MKTKLFLMLFFMLLSILTFNACGPNEFEHDFSEYYSRYGVEGEIVIYDLKESSYHYYNKKNCEKRTSPASTYKILNSMIFLEEGIVADIEEELPWDGKWRQSAQWNKPHNLKSAFKYSVVWFFQHYARKTGRNIYTKWHDKIGYGNKAIGNLIDKFWLDGSLKISPIEQIAFLKKLYENKLPFGSETQAAVKKIMLYSDDNKYRVYGKTGTSKEDNIGWFVGWYEIDGNVYFFANRIDAGSSFSLPFFASRIQIVNDIITEEFIKNK